VLLGAQELPRAADLQVRRGQPEPGPELAELLQRSQTATREVGERVRARDDEVRVGVLTAAPDPSASLPRNSRSTHSITRHSHGPLDVTGMN